MESYIKKLKWFSNFKIPKMLKNYWKKLLKVQKMYKKNIAKCLYANKLIENMK